MTTRRFSWVGIGFRMHPVFMLFAGLILLLVVSATLSIVAKTLRHTLEDSTFQHAIVTLGVVAAVIMLGVWCGVGLLINAGRAARDVARALFRWRK